ncbi:hypothetical protein LWC34_04885 [Kibdelosporangium philippinense]|uniref:Uncharacterized protein n=2 Tax=Kibdelosporangium philippinense TaxID=211113 RepID=A0ABS8Z2U5_9PSEU|nr:hypothetical protein [Kibdelosporangium philippinense]MCE7002165.1 hypothetical protein [Kibdelosporangium philippinense]
MSVTSISEAAEQFGAVLDRENRDEELGQLSPHERLSCPVHRRWVHQCVSSPLHVIPVTGHRWCRRCECAHLIAIDEIDGTVSMWCPCCGEVPTTLASRQITRACLQSLAAWRSHRDGRADRAR